MIDKVKWIDSNKDFEELQVFDKWTTGYATHYYLPVDLMSLYVFIILLFVLTEQPYIYLMGTFILLVYQWWSYEFLNKWWQWLLLIILFIIQVPFIMLWIVPLVYWLKKSSTSLQIMITDIIIYLMLSKIF